MTFMIKTNSFNKEDIIPAKYTCDGDNISPPLKWEDAPNGTQSFVFILDDPDTPLGIWNHWLIYNLPNNIHYLTENIKTLPSPAKLGTNSWGRDNYRGPCPPSGEHRYFFKLFAINQQIDSKDKVSRANIEQLIKPYIIGKTILMGRYTRKHVNN